MKSNQRNAVVMIFHICASIHFWIACVYDWLYVQVPIEKLQLSGNLARKANKFKYLTYWNAVLQAIFFTLCILNDLKNTESRVTKVTNIKNLVFSSLAFPLSLFVGSTFWGIYFVDRELIFPVGIEKYFPNWLNHAMHTNILILTFIELSTSLRAYPPRKTGISILISFMAFYLIWIHCLYYDSGVWVYPILNVLNFPSRIAFFAILLVFSVSLYITGEFLNNVICKLRSINRKTK